LQEGARKLLQAAIENEVIDYIQFHKDRRDENGQRLVVRNGHLPEREVVSGVGPIPVRQPRVRHRDKGRLSSAILPKYMRRAPSVDALLPALYLKGISTGDFSEALTAILGGVLGISARPALDSPYCLGRATKGVSCISVGRCCWMVFTLCSARSTAALSGKKV
jgi:putative transposase